MKPPANTSSAAGAVRSDTWELSWDPTASSWSWQEIADSLVAASEGLTRLLDDSGTRRWLAKLRQRSPQDYVAMQKRNYDRYAAALHDTFLPRYGGEVLYAGDGSTALVAEEGQAWDAVLCIRYPSRSAFSRMVADPEYQQVTALRTTAARAVSAATSIFTSSARRSLPTTSTGAWIEGTPAALRFSASAAPTACGYWVAMGM